jgi:hypothetical protein
LEIHDFREHWDFVEPIFPRNGIDFAVFWEESGQLKMDRLLRGSLFAVARWGKIVVVMHLEGVAVGCSTPRANWGYRMVGSSMLMR